MLTTPKSTVPMSRSGAFSALALILALCAVFALLGTVGQ